MWQNCEWNDKRTEAVNTEWDLSLHKLYIPHGQNESGDRIPEVREHKSIRQQSRSIKVKGFPSSVGTTSLLSLSSEQRSDSTGTTRLFELSGCVPTDVSLYNKSLLPGFCIVFLQGALFVCFWFCATQPMLFTHDKFSILILVIIWIQLAVLILLSCKNTPTM
jgi:hypothetical protein